MINLKFYLYRSNEEMMMKNENFKTIFLIIFKATSK